MKKKFIKLVIPMLIASMLLTACGEDSSTAQGSPSSQSTTQTPEVSTPEVNETVESAEFVPVTITDQGGFDVTIDSKPLNVAMAGLPPFTSFFLQFTGDTDVIASMPGNSITYPNWIERVFPEYANINVVGMGPNFEVEDILALEPDLIICSTGWEEKYQTFRETDIPTIGLSSTSDGTNTIATTNSWISILGDVFNEQDKAKTIVENNNRLLELVNSKTADVQEKLTGLMLPDYSENIIEVSNDDYYGGFWLANSGMENSAKDIVGWESNMEEILALNPDIIYLSAFSAYEPSDLLSDSAVAGHTWSATNAGQNGMIFKFPVGIFNWYALSPDSPISMLWIASSAYPELFDDVDITAEIKNHYSLYGINLTDEEVANLIEQR